MDQSSVDLEQQVTILYQLLGHRVEKAIRRGTQVTDLIIKAKTGETWLARCVYQSEVGDSVVRDCVQTIRTKGVQQFAILTFGQFSSEARRLAQQASVNLVDGTELKRYLPLARTFAEERGHPSNQQSLSKTLDSTRAQPPGPKLSLERSVIVVPPEPRYTIEDMGDKLRVLIPAKRSWYFIVVAGLIVGMLLVSILTSETSRSLITSMFRGNPLGPIWFVWMFAIFVYLFLVLLWMLFGVEIVEVDQDSIKARRQLYGIGRTLEYQGKFIWNLRAAPIVYPMPTRRGLFDSGPSFFLESVGLAGGQIAFEYFSKIVRFGGSLNETEARMLVELIIQRFHNYDHSQ